MNTISCNIESITPFNQFVYQVKLKPATPFDFMAGQYLSVVMGEKDKRPFSIASAPNQKCIELHIGASVKESYPMQVVERMQECQQKGLPIDIEAPSGVAYLREDSPRPRILIAGGTGFSYVKSIIEQQIALNQQVETTLYWGCRNLESMYYHSKAAQWQQDYPWFHFIPVLQEADGDWKGKKTNLLAQVKSDFIGLYGYDIYIVGRFDMVGAARELFREMGVDEQHLYGDAFAFIK